MILESGLGIIGWFVVGLLCLGLAAAALLVAEEVRERRAEVREHRAMTIIRRTPQALYPDIDHWMPTAADVFALAANLRTMDDEFDAWLADRSLRTFDEFCEAVATQRLTGCDDAPGRRAMRTWLLHWGPDWNGNESSGGL